MNLQEVMEKRNFVVVGDTLNEEKFACKIKVGLAEQGYNVQAVGKELASINDIDGEMDILDLCIHPVKGLKLLQECKKEIPFVVIQPGAGDEALTAYLDEAKIPYIADCVHIGLHKYPKNWNA